jgi:hypothetical protein
MRKVDGCADTAFNGDFFRFITMSHGGMSYSEPSAPELFLPPDADDVTLGKTLRTALKASKQISGEEFFKLFQSGVVQQLGKEREAWTMQHYGYKTKRALYRHMASCYIELIDGWLEINPSHSDQKGGFQGLSADGHENIRLPDSVSDAELGAALREGFKRCTGAVALD